ncbi:MAG: ATP-binding cassette domain-containing protein, partial [Pseudomonadota bacterium]
RFTGDLAAFRGWVSLGIARLIAASIVLPAGLAAMVLIDPALATPAAIAVSLGALAMALLGLSFGHLHRRLRRRRAALSARMAERVGKAPELRLLGRLVHERRAFERRSARMIEAAIKRAGAAAVLRAIPDATAGLAAAGVIAAALTGSVSAAQTAGALAAVGFMVQPLRDLAGTWDQRRAFVAARAACETLLAEEPLPRGRVVPVRPSTDQGGAPLAFRGVESAALREIDLRIKAGEHVAVLGPNGAGKSALLALAAGLEAPQKGKVLVAGHPVCRLKDGARSRLICHVGAGSPVLDGSLRRALVPQDRVRADGSRLDDAAIEATARRYGLGEVVDRLGGLDGRVTEGARTLSAGERRRLLLTRAALSEAELILLDEPDDALDDTAAALVGRLLRETKATVLLVTHDPAVARLAERTLRIEAGRLAPALPIADFGPESAVAA